MKSVDILARQPVCRKCENPRPLDDYYVINKKTGTRSKICKLCQRQRKNDSYHAKIYLTQTRKNTSVGNSDLMRDMKKLEYWQPFLQRPLRGL